jgi:hypothetical protein
VQHQAIKYYEVCDNLVLEKDKNEKMRKYEYVLYNSNSNFNFVHFYI